MCVFYLGNQSLVLTQPGLPHGRLAVEASRQLLQFLLANELRPQSQLALVLRLLQTLPGLSQRSIRSPFVTQHPSAAAVGSGVMGQGSGVGAHLVDVRDELALAGGVHLLVVGPHPALDGEQKDLQVPLLCEPETTATTIIIIISLLSPSSSSSYHHHHHPYL